jgi:hypothetical protein
MVDALTAKTPLLLVLEDLHWSDYATLDLLALLARRRTPARLLIVATFRPVETLVPPIRCAPLYRICNGTVTRWRSPSHYSVLRRSRRIWRRAFPSSSSRPHWRCGCMPGRTASHCFWSPWCRRS